jgi:hypothetical protein
MLESISVEGKPSPVDCTSLTKLIIYTSGTMPFDCRFSGHWLCSKISSRLRLIRCWWWECLSHQSVHGATFGPSLFLHGLHEAKCHWRYIRLIGVRYVVCALNQTAMHIKNKLCGCFVVISKYEILIVLNWYRHLQLCRYALPIDIAVEVVWSIKGWTCYITVTDANSWYGC